MEVPKILILSRSFDNGDGITISNLFSKFPINKMFLATLNYNKNLISKFKEIYILGNEELKYHFPFNYLLRINKTQIISNPLIQQEDRKIKIHPSILKKIFSDLFRKCFQFIDLYEDKYKLYLSNDFIKWIELIKPDIIYTSVGDSPMAQFILDIKKRFPDIKFAIQGFDDWMNPSYFCINAKKHFHKRDKIYRQILSSSSYFLASSQKMADDYYLRYNYNFNVFPNPVKITNQANSIDPKTNNILFIGKIAFHNINPIIDMIKAVDKLNKEGINISFDIYTNSQDFLRQKISKLPNTTFIYPFIPHEEILKVIHSARILFLPINISNQNKKFTKYSMSTKIGEYLSSGKPIIYIGPEEIAMTTFFKKQECGYIITDRGITPIINVIKNIIETNDLFDNRRVDLANKYFDIDILSNKLLDFLSQ